LAGLEDSQEGAETLLQLADLHVTSLASYAGGTAYAERALAMVERLGDKGLKARALCVLGNIKARSNNPAAGTAELERSRALAEQIDEPALAAEACAYLANVYAWTGNLVRSRDLTLQRLQLAERTHDPFEFRHVYSWLGVLETLQGRWSEADAWFARQERALAGLQTPEPLATLRAGQGLLHYYLGQFDRAERAYRETIALLQPINPGSLVWYLGRLALVLIEMEAREEAVNCLAELQELAAPLPEQASARLCALTYLAVSYTRLGLRNEAAACLPGLLPFRGQFAPIPVERALGLAAMSADKTADARRYLAHAETRAREAGMTPELALILLERGHLDRGRRPVAATVEGLDLCEQLGMRELGQRFTGTTIGAQGAGLTRRELDVLRLVAEGQSNREIADALFLSEYTVARHLTHIFTKTGVENRAAAAAYALRHNVV
jgi:DNA-binding CsgD family transcriptional regulator